MIIATAHLPTLDATLEVSLSRSPYMAKIGEHETYLFDLNGEYLAKLYDEHGENILQQNFRMFEGDKGTNLAIAQTASSEVEAKDFFHYNNGISVICDSATFQPFNNKLRNLRISLMLSLRAIERPVPKGHANARKAVQ